MSTSKVILTSNNERIFIIHIQITSKPKTFVFSAIVQFYPWRLKNDCRIINLSSKLSKIQILKAMKRFANSFFSSDLVIRFFVRFYDIDDMEDEFLKKERNSHKSAFTKL